MNVCENIDYSTMFDAMRVTMSADISQMKLYCELGRLIFQRTEKGAAVAAAEYLQRTYPDVPGLSPRNLRRMRDFYHVYEGTPDLLDLAMKIGWTQNVVILEADLNTEERRWYLCAVKQFGWSKTELQRRIESQVHRKVYLNEPERQCYIECEPQELDHTKYDQDAPPIPKLYLLNSKSQVYHEQFGKEPPRLDQWSCIKSETSASRRSVMQFIHLPGASCSSMVSTVLAKHPSNTHMDTTEV